MTISTRLVEALARKRWTKKTFTTAIAEKMNEGGQSGITYQTILAYFSGSSEPSLNWIRTAALILDVTPKWIAFGGEVRELGFSSQEKQDTLNFIFDMRARVGKLEEFAADLIVEREKENADALERAYSEDQE